jgi:hypothetical protein
LKHKINLLFSIVNNLSDIFEIMVLFSVPPTTLKNDLLDQPAPEERDHLI